MISSDSFEREWIISRRSVLGKADPSIVEVVIRAFSLLENLQLQDLNFIFKGGTSLMLLISPPVRFSTDIDIATTASRKEIESALDEIIGLGAFKRWELDEERSYLAEGIPKAHYKLYFDSVLSGIERNVLLDILFEQTDYPQIVTAPLNIELLVTSGNPTTVNVPSLNCLLGDKLTAFAPKTIGIPVGKYKHREIVKQIFDIGRLFDKYDNNKVVEQVYLSNAKRQLGYRGLDSDVQLVKDDMVNAAIAGCKLLRGIHDDKYNDYLQEMAGGLRAFDPLLIGKGTYLREQCVTDTLKAACIVSSMLHGKVGEFRLYDAEKMDINASFFKSGEFVKFNRLAKLNGGALYYLNSICTLNEISAG